MIFCRSNISLIGNNVITSDGLLLIRAARQTKLFVPEISLIERGLLTTRKMNWHLYIRGVTFFDEFLYLNVHSVRDSRSYSPLKNPACISTRPVKRVNEKLR